jgi:hypothetical protein
LLEGEEASVGGYNNSNLLCQYYYSCLLYLISTTTTLNPVLLSLYYFLSLGFHCQASTAGLVLAPGKRLCRSSSEDEYRSMALALAVTVWIGLIILSDVGFSLTCAFFI